LKSSWPSRGRGFGNGMRVLRKQEGLENIEQNKKNVVANAKTRIEESVELKVEREKA